VGKARPMGGAGPGSYVEEEGSDGAPPREATVV
jgi:hypothetical protein